MNSDKLKNKNNEEEKIFKPDIVEVRKAKKTLQFFVKTFSLMKIYPPENPAIKNSIDLFANKLKEFLNIYQELKIGIWESSFSFKGETLFEDERRRKNLPFLFFKDGMRELSFYKGLDNEELQDFLEIIKEDSNLPPEISDIVSSLWEKDFVHIRYLVLEEFLESDIGFDIDRQEFSKGAIGLTSKDKNEFLKISHALGFSLDEEKENEEDKKKSPAKLTPATQIPVLTKDEIPEIESMISASRQTSSMAELVTLLFEILFLEERYDQFLDFLNITYQCYQDVVPKADFSTGLLILSQIQELKEMFSSKSEEKAEALEKVLKRAKEEISIPLFNKLFLDGKIKDFESFFKYLKVLGPGTVPLLDTIWKDSKYPHLRQKVLDFLKEIGHKDITSLVSIAQGDDASLTKEIIILLGKIGDKKAIPHLGNFVNFRNKEIRLAAIQSLGKIGDEAANKILIKLLTDKDEEIRTMAAMNLKYFKDKTTIEYVKQLTKKKDFKKRNKTEKTALFIFLASSHNEEIYSFFMSFLKKSSFFFKSRQNESRLCIVSALELMATPKAVEILKEGTRLRKKIIRQACQHSLRNLAAKNESKKAIKGE